MFLSKPHEINIRDIDKELFIYLFTNKVALKSQIARDIFPKISHQAIYKRLNKLSRYNYIDKKYHQDLNGRIIYSLGKVALFEYFGEETKEKKIYKSDSLKHDLALVDIRSILSQRSSVKKYYSEALLKSKEDTLPSSFEHFYSEIRPDAIIELVLNKKEFRFSLEYEASLKFKKRYLSLFDKYLKQDFVQGILYVTKDKKLQNRISNIQRKNFSDSPPIFFYVTLTELLTNKELIFTNINGQKIDLGGCKDWLQRPYTMQPGLI